VLSNDWARFWTVTPPVNAVRMSDCQAAAQLRFQALYDTSLAGWQMTADWQIDSPFLACAIPTRSSLACSKCHPPIGSV
jgi:hypothetical protein